MKKMTTIQKLSLDTYNQDVTNYSVEDGNDAIRALINDACGGEFNYYTWLDNRGAVFSVISEALSIGLGEILIDQFNGFAEVHDVELGDKKVFPINTDKLFRVATVAEGVSTIRRQTIYNSMLEVTTKKLAIKVFTEMDLFMSNRVSWTKLITMVNMSYANEIGTRVYNAVYNSYDSLSAPYQVTGTYDATVLATTIGHVEAQSGKKASIYGTKLALSKVTDAQISEKMKDEWNKFGHYGMFRGTEMKELPQAHVVGTDTFAVNDSFLLILPEGEDFVKIVLEGDARVYENMEGDKNFDETIEFMFGRLVGIAILIARNFAVIRLS